METRIDIREFRGVATNADGEDLPDTVLSDLVNLVPRRGNVVKTFGFGLTVGTALPSSINAFHALVHSSLSGGYQYLAAFVDMQIGGEYRMYLYRFSGGTWSIVPVDGGGPVWQANDRNPVIQDGNAVRFLCGAVSKPDGANRSKSLWHGYIDWKLFDGGYTPDARFYTWPTDIIPPDLTSGGIGLSLSTVAGGDFTAGDRHYKLSYVYDGEQESLPSPARFVTCAADTWVRLGFTLGQGVEHFNHRVTALNVYRSDTGSAGLFKLIQMVDFLRPAGEVRTGTSALMGRYHVYLSSCSYSLIEGRQYRLAVPSLGATTYQIVFPGAGVQDRFKWSSLDLASTNWWDTDWSLSESSDGGATYEEVATGSRGLYSGERVLIVETDLADTYLIGGQVAMEGIFRAIGGHHRKAVLVGESYFGTDISSRMDALAWIIFPPGAGTYAVSSAAGVHTYTVYDLGDSNNPPGEEHPLVGEKSIMAHGNHARLIGRRMLLGDVVLDPGGTAERYEDGVICSEIDQLDVFPGKNLLLFRDREGGGITGIGELFGNPVILKRHSILAIRNFQEDPAVWRIETAAHNIGNLARFGSVCAMDQLFVCHADGIYRLRPNNLAESDETPTEQLRISEPIGDIYRALTHTQKAAIEAAFDQAEGEVLFGLGAKAFSVHAASRPLNRFVVSGDWHGFFPVKSVFRVTGSTANDGRYPVFSTAYDAGLTYIYVDSSAVRPLDSTGDGVIHSGQTWAFDLANQFWRRIESSVAAEIWGRDENDDLMIYNGITRLFHGAVAKESVKGKLRTREFVVSTRHPEPVRYGILTYRTPRGITVRMYADGETTPRKTVTLPGRTVAGTQLFPLGRRAMRFFLEFEEVSASTDEMEISRIQIFHEGRAGG